MKIVFPLCLFTLLLFSCNKKKIGPEDCTTPIDPPITNLLWKKLIDIYENSSCLTNSPLVFKNDIIFDAWWCGENGETRVIRLDGETGEKKWEFSDPSLFDYISSLNLINEDKLFISTSGNSAVISSNTGEMDWNTHLVYDDHLTSTYDNELFVVTSLTASQNLHSELQKSNFQNENWNKIYETDSLNGYTTGMLPPIFNINNNGDKMLYILERGYKLGFNPLEKFDLHAYNMTQDTVQWIAKDLVCEWQQTSTGTNHVPQIYNGKIYVQSGRSVYCIDMETGEQIWDQCFLGESFYRTANLIANDVIVLNSESAKMFGVSTETGEILWTKDDGGYSWENMAQYNGIVYYSDVERIVGLNINTGEEVWSYANDRSENSNASFVGSLAIDPERKVLYASDHFYMYAISLE